MSNENNANNGNQNGNGNTGIAVFIVDSIVIENPPRIKFLERALLCLTAAIGAGCFWIGLSINGKK